MPAYSYSRNSLTDQDDCDDAQVESKLFFLDARKNQRGVYLKISERKDSTESRATVVFPSDTIPRLLQYLDRCTLQASQG